MGNEKLRCVYLNVKEGKAPEVLEVEEDNALFHQLLKCDTIDVPLRQINGRPYRIIVDDDGGLKEDKILSSFDPLWGNLLIFGPEDDEGYLTGLKDEDLVFILSRFVQSRCAGPSIGKWLLITD